MKKTNTSKKQTQTQKQKQIGKIIDSLEQGVSTVRTVSNRNIYVLQKKVGGRWNTLVDWAGPITFVARDEARKVTSNLRKDNKNDSYRIVRFTTT
jgi:hypothetical protein